MKFLVDQNLPPDLALEIRRKGQQAEHVFHVGLDHVDDATLIRFARQGDWVIVSRDADFVHQAGGDDIITWFQLIWIRLGICSNEELFDAWSSSWDRVST